jgi:hypothetical protein
MSEEGEEETYVDSVIDVDISSIESRIGNAQVTSEEVPIPFVVAVAVMFVIFSALFAFLLYKEEKTRKIPQDVRPKFAKVVAPPVKRSAGPMVRRARGRWPRR